MEDKNRKRHIEKLIKTDKEKSNCKQIGTTVWSWMHPIGIVEQLIGTTVFPSKPIWYKT